MSRFALSAAVAGLLVSETRHLADEVLALANDTDRFGVTLAKRWRRLGFVYDLLELSLSGRSRVRVCIGGMDSAAHWCGTQDGEWRRLKLKKSDSDSDSDSEAKAKARIHRVRFHCD